jgi:UDP-N-acetylglucosamine 3-dehydrogenase
VEGIISIDYTDQAVQVYGKNAQKVKVTHKEPLKDAQKLGEKAANIIKEDNY